MEDLNYQRKWKDIKDPVQVCWLEFLGSAKVDFSYKYSIPKIDNKLII